MDSTMETETPKGIMTYFYAERSVLQTEEYRLNYLSLCFIFYSQPTRTQLCQYIAPEKTGAWDREFWLGSRDSRSSLRNITHTHLKLAYFYLHMYTIFFLKDICKLNDSWRMHSICQELWLQATAFLRWACIMFTRHIVLHALDIISRFKTSQIKIKL